MRTALVLTGGRAADGPYGIDKLEDFGYRLIDVPNAQNRLHRKFRDVGEHRLGQPIDKALRSSWKVRQADLIIAFLEREALTAAWLKRHRVPPWHKVPLVMFECWLAEELRHMNTTQRQKAVGQYAGVDLIFAWSANQLDILIEAGFEAERVAAVPFGFAPESYPFVPMQARTGGIVAMGFDRGRDYPTLFDAVEGTDLHVRLVCKAGNLEGRIPPRNVEFLGTVPYVEYQRLLSDAEIVVVPTKELAYPTGQTVAMEAAASGACLVVTGTTPMKEYFSDSTALLVPPRDPDALRKALSAARDDDALRVVIGAAASQSMMERFTYHHMWDHVDETLRARNLGSGS